MTNYYRVYLKSRKRTGRMISRTFDMAVANSWIEYKPYADNLRMVKKD